MLYNVWNQNLMLNLFLVERQNNHNFLFFVLLYHFQVPGALELNLLFKFYDENFTTCTSTWYYYVTSVTKVYEQHTSIFKISWCYFIELCEVMYVFFYVITFEKVFLFTGNCVKMEFYAHLFRHVKARLDWSHELYLTCYYIKVNNLNFFRIHKKEKKR